MNGESIVETMKALPKIELHRHLEGAVRLQTLVDIAREHGFEMPEYDIEQVRPFVQMMPEEQRTHKNFLAKFRTIRQYFRSPQIIKRIARECVEDAAADNIKYMELRFTPCALCQVCECTVNEAVGWVCEAVAEAAARTGIQVRLIVSMNRHESLEIGQEVTEAALAFRDKGVVALDLAGDEAHFAAAPFAALFHQARDAGLHLTVHAGEWGGAESVWDAVQNLGAERIGHGIRALEDRAVVNVLVTRGVLLEVCPTSNYHSGVVPDLRAHPLPQLIRSGLRVSVNTDDPLVCAINLSDELVSAMQHMPFSLDDIKELQVLAARHSFLPDDERGTLVGQFETWMANGG